MEFKVINGMATVHIADEKKALAFKTRNMLSMFELALKAAGAPLERFELEETEHDRFVKVVYTGGEEQMVCATCDADPTIIWDIEQHCPKLHERG